MERNGRIRGMIALFVAGLVSSPFVSAYGYTDVGSLIQSVINSIQNIGTPVFASLFGTYTTDDFLFTKILLFIYTFYFSENWN